MGTIIRRWIPSFLLLAAVATSPASRAERLLFLRSGPARTNLVELFSSEGCSSCPSADAWLASLRGRDSLWKSFVPVEFHVDYWNRLGWTDRFSKEAFTARQRAYAEEWGNWNVYTPGLVLNGSEWRPRAPGADRELETSQAPAVGVLEVRQISGNRFRLSFEPAAAGGSWQAYGALLGDGLVSHVNSGENSGSTLRHEFVALALAHKDMVSSGSRFAAEIELEQSVASGARSFSVAFWVSRTGTQRPVQAVGGDW